MSGTTASTVGLALMGGGTGLWGVVHYIFDCLSSSEFDGHGSVVQNISWKADGSLLASVCKVRW